MGRLLDRSGLAGGKILVAPVSSPPLVDLDLDYYMVVVGFLFFNLGHLDRCRVFKTTRGASREILVTK